MEISGLMGITGEQDRTKAMKKVAVEMETEFVNEMLKEMRKTTEGGFFGKGAGSDIFASMFDMEIARKVAERGIGLQEFLVKGMMKYEDAANEAKAAQSAAKAEALTGGKTTPATEPAKITPAPDNGITNNVEIIHNPLKTNGNDIYTLEALKFSDPSADKRLEKLSRR